MSPQRSHQQCTILEKLDFGSQYRLVLIVARSGTGKIKYLQRWVQKHLATTPTPPLWLEIKAEDNHPIHFLNRLLSECMGWDPNIMDHFDLSLVDVQTPPGEVSPESKSSPGLSPAIEIVLTGLINGLIHLEGDRFLILDNYQIIHEPHIHGIVAYLIDYLPPNFHLIISSQVNPPLQIPRLRVRRELLEINSEDMI